MKHDWKAGKELGLTSAQAMKWIMCSQCGFLRTPKNADNDCIGKVKVATRCQ